MGGYEQVAKKSGEKKNKNPIISPKIQVLSQITIKISLFDVFPS